MPANDLIIFRKGSGDQWISSNPILASGEPGYDVTNNILKIGDGVSNWQSLSSHKHNISDINSFASGVADTINTEMVGGSGISLIYNSQNNTVTISVTGIVSGGGEGNTGPIMVSDITDFNSGVSGLIENIYAPLSSPAFTGIPIVPTANSGSNDNQIANTKFVRNEIASVVNSAPEALDTLYELASALGSDSNFSTTVTNSLSNKASLSGAVFTGSVTISSGSINATTLSVTGVPVSVSGHSHSSSDIIGLTSTIESTLDTSLVGGTGIVLSFDQNTQTLSINASNTGLSLSSTDSLPEGSSNLYFTNSRASGASPVQSVAGRTGVVTLSGSDVGLSNVDNTSDTNKPISLAVQSGLDLKAAAVHSHIISDISGLELSLSGKQPSGNYSTLDSSANFSSLTVNSTTVSLSGHSHSYSDITNFSSGVASSLSTELVGGSGISLVYDSNNNTVNISVTGIVGGGGTTGPIYTTGIVDFNTGVSGLLTDYAPLNSPALTGTPIAPTAPTGTNSNQIASTEFVRNEIANLVASAPSTLDTLNEIALSLNNDANFSSTIVSGLASKASLSGATFSGSIIIPSGSINANTLTVDNIPVSVSGHTHIASNISGLDTAINNQLDTSIVAGSGITFTYDSGSSTLTISATGVSSGGGGSLSGSVTLPADPYFNSVSLLLQGDGNLMDSSSAAHSVTGYGSVTATGTAKFGSNSLSFSGSSSYLRVAGNTAFSLPGDFTIEFWVYFNAAPSSYGGGSYGSNIIATYPGPGVNAGWQLRINGTSTGYNTINVYTGETDINWSATFNLNQWHHVAVTRSGSSMKAWVDGVQAGSTITNTDSMTPSSTNDLWVGRLNLDTLEFQLNGLLDDVRITKGVARTITVPTAAYPVGQFVTGGTYPVNITGSSSGSSGLSWSSVPSGSTDTGSAGQIAYDNNYFYIATSTNAWKRALLSKWPLVSMNYLLVAGGGGGGGGRGAGGGAGGYVYSATSVPVGESISVVVGDGGSGSTNSVTAQNGSNSSITLPSSETVVALGGGGGADGLKGLFTGSGMSGASGGSGGGGSGYNPVGSGGSGTVDQGYAGGAGYGGGEPYNGGGGGGAGGAGGSGQIANGGVGKADTILAVTSAGVDVGGTRYIAGGGGAGSYNYTPGTGGIGGGGDGGNTSVNGNNAVANTGGGGGGGGNGADGGSGGSGIVILRCPDSFTATTTGSPTIYVTGGYRYYKFTQNGTITFVTV
jgi:hypothetical protein